jgi:hypothetical protein
MRTSKIDLVFCAALVISLLCGAVAFAIPFPAPCGPPCKEIYLKYGCASGNCAVLSKSDCNTCENDGCTVGGDTTLVCLNAVEMITADFYAGGVQACRACAANEFYIEASLYEGAFLFTISDVPRHTCQVRAEAEEDGEVGGQ